MKTVYLYDTTLRDGTQSQEISLSVLDKVSVAEKLDDFGIHYIEGIPREQPKDKEFFDLARKIRWKNSVLCAFGMTRRVGKKVDEDGNMKALVAAGTPVITVVGKSWDFHVFEALRTTLEENLHAVKETVVFLKKHADKSSSTRNISSTGTRNNPKYTMKVLAAPRTPATPRPVRHQRRDDAVRGRADREGRPEGDGHGDRDPHPQRRRDGGGQLAGRRVERGRPRFRGRSTGTGAVREREPLLGDPARS